MSNFFKLLTLTRIGPGDTFKMAVYDSFEGRFKLLKKSLGKIYVEVVDVCMCYPQLVQSQPGEKYWIEEEHIAEIFKNENEQERANRVKKFFTAPFVRLSQRCQKW